MDIQENRIMHTREDSPLRLLMSVMLVVVFSAYIGNSHADETRSHRGQIQHINGSIELHSHEQAGNLRTVNGRIHLHQNSHAEKAQTVNGSIDLGEGSRIRAADTVNGSIRGEHNVSVSESLQTVNGSIRLQSGSQVAGDVHTVNGTISLFGTAVAGNLHTVNGRIALSEGSVVEGDLTIDRKQRNRGFFSRLFRRGDVTPGRIDIDATSRVHGDIHLYRETRLEIHPDAVVGRIYHHY